MPWFYYVTVVLLKAFFLLFTRCHVNGRDNIPGSGPVLIVANHLSNTDPPLLGVCLLRAVKFMAKSELFRKPFFAYILYGYGAFPVRRGQLDRQALRLSYQSLTDGSTLVMFPEGTRSLDAKLQPALPGPALIAMRSGVPLLPIGITGTEKIKGLAWLLRRPKIVVNIGRPFYLPQTDGHVSKEGLAEAVTVMMCHIAELLPPEYRGVYGEEVSL